MVSRAAYSVFTLGESADADGEAPEFEMLVSTLTRLWANALRFPGYR
jgi:hypothetical protein